MKNYPIGYDNTPDDTTSIFVPDDDDTYDYPDGYDNGNNSSGGGGNGGCLSVMLVKLATATSLVASSIFVLLNY